MIAVPTTTAHAPASIAARASSGVCTRPSQMMGRPGIPRSPDAGAAGRGHRHGAVDGGDTVRECGGYQVEAHINRTANVLDGGTIRHQEHTLLVQRAEGILDRLAIGTRTIGGVDRHDIGTRSNAGTSVTQRRRDVNASCPSFHRPMTGTSQRPLMAAMSARPWQRMAAAPPSSQARDIEPWSRAYEAARPYTPERSRRACPSGTGSKDQRSCSTQPFSKQPSETPHLDVQTVARVPKYASLLFHVNLRHLRRRTW
mgnify:CR=1 FL=1